MGRLPGAFIAVLVVLAACGVRPTSEPASSVSATSGRTDAPASPASPGIGPGTTATSATPAEVPEEQQFSLDDAEFDDGLLIEIAGAVADKAARTGRAAEATDGEIVIASIRIENATREPYAAESVLIGAKYGNGKDAQIIIGKTDDLQSGFTGMIKVGEDAVSTVGFAVPFSELEKVTFIVDPNDDLHAAISFTGPVQRD